MRDTLLEKVLRRGWCDTHKTRYVSIVKDDRTEIRCIPLTELDKLENKTDYSAWKKVWTIWVPGKEPF